MDTTSNPNEMKALLDAARAANSVLRGWFDKAAKSADRDELLGTQQKTSHYDHYGYEDTFTHADVESEQTILSILHQCRPDITVVAEESSATCADDLPEGTQRWLVDPLDGTLRFKQGDPNFSATLALQTKVNGVWKTDIGVVSVPMMDRIYVAGDKNAFVLHHGMPMALTNTEPKPPPFGGKALDTLRGKHIEDVVYSKTNPAIFAWRPHIKKTLDGICTITNNFSAAYMIAGMAEAGGIDGVILGANALDFAWDTDAAIHIAQHSGIRCKRLVLDGEPFVILAKDKSLLLALEKTIRSEYQQCKHAIAPESRART